MISNTLGVVLAGGASTRMGRDKAVLEFEGATLLERAAATMADVFTTVVVSGGPIAPMGIARVPDGVYGGGPLAGLDAAYGVAAGRAVFLLALDMPFVDAPTIRAIAETAVPSHGARIPLTEDTRQPLCALYGSGLGSLAHRHLKCQDRSMAGFISDIDAAEFVDMDTSKFMNINTVEDLKAARLRSGPSRNTH